MAKTKTKTKQITLADVLPENTTSTQVHVEEQPTKEIETKETSFVKQPERKGNRKTEKFATSKPKNKTNNKEITQKKEIASTTKPAKNDEIEANKKRKNNKQEEMKPSRVRRIRADYTQGLTTEQAEDRKAKGHSNYTPNTNVKTYKSIFLENIVTFFNIICFIIAISLICVGKIQETLFMVIILANVSIGIFQEIRAKKTIEKLSLLTAPTVDVIRDGHTRQVSTSEIVLDDIIKLTVGKQLPADCTVIEGSVEVNESLLTGESLPIKKNIGDTLLSGSFIVSGECYARVEKVAKNCYIEQLASKAKKYKRPKSELFISLNKIIKVIGFIIIPIGISMYVKNYVATDHNITETISMTAGSIIGMIPAGMFLLCSVTLAVSVIKLARKQALVQDLYCVEMLARVNVLCLDKTGTITDGTMKVYNCLEVNNTSDYTLKRIVGSMLSALKDNNQTSQALINYFGYSKELHAKEILPFSSSRKLSAVTFEEGGTYILGAPEFVMPQGMEPSLAKKIEQYAKDGYRVLLLAHSKEEITGEKVPKNKTAVAVLVLEDRIRDDAVETIKWFKENNVQVKIISGDNPLTVAEIAKRVGVANTDKFINLEGLNEKQVIAAANTYTVFGRVTPEQKAILIKAIKSAGNTVAMTGDGVNDILAMKESDCAIAMASGSEAVRSVAHMVLLNSQFKSMPDTVREGRRVINNVQSASSLFFMKTIFSIVFSIFILAVPGQTYPFNTMRLMLLEYFVIGIPSFFLAFRANEKQVSGKFIFNLIKNALPAGLTLLLNVGAVYVFCYATGTTDTDMIGSMATLILTYTGLAMLFRLCKPYNVLTTILFTAMAVTITMCVIFASTFFTLVPIGLTNALFIIILTLIAPTVIDLLYKLIDTIKMEK